MPYRSQKQVGRQAAARKLLLQHASGVADFRAPQVGPFDFAWQRGDDGYSTNQTYKARLEALWILW